MPWSTAPVPCAWSPIFNVAVLVTLDGSLLVCPSAISMVPQLLPVCMPTCRAKVMDTKLQFASQSSKMRHAWLFSCPFIKNKSRTRSLFSPRWHQNSSSVPVFCASFSCGVLLALLVAPTSGEATCFPAPLDLLQSSAFTRPPTAPRPRPRSWAAFRLCRPSFRASIGLHLIHGLL